MLDTILLVVCLTIIFYALLHTATKIKQSIQLKKRVDSLKINPQSQAGKSKLNSAADYFYEFLERYQLLSGEFTENTRRSVQRAGYNTSFAFNVYIMSLFITPTVFAIAALISQQAPWVIVIAFAAGFMLPKYILGQKQKHYNFKLSVAVPDAVDLMIICFSASYSNDQTIKKIADTLHHTHPELANEFAITSTELKVLPDRQQAWINLSERCDCKDITSIIRILQQNERFGSPILATLKSQAKYFRESTLLTAEGKAAKLPTKMMFPMMVFFFPILFAIMVTPVVLRFIDRI